VRLEYFDRCLDIGLAQVLLAYCFLFINGFLGSPASLILYPAVVVCGPGGPCQGRCNDTVTPWAITCCQRPAVAGPPRASPPPIRRTWGAGWTRRAHARANRRPSNAGQHCSNTGPELTRSKHCTSRWSFDLTRSTGPPRAAARRGVGSGRGANLKEQKTGSSCALGRRWA
jgi:hypothetical protein